MQCFVYCTSGFRKEIVKLFIDGSYFFYLLSRCPTANCESLSRRLPNSPDFKYCVYSNFDPEFTGALADKTRESCFGIWINSVIIKIEPRRPYIPVSKKEKPLSLLIFQCLDVTESANRSQNILRSTWNLKKIKVFLVVIETLCSEREHLRI